MNVQVRAAFHPRGYTASPGVVAGVGCAAATTQAGGPRRRRALRQAWRASRPHDRDVGPNPQDDRPDRTSRDPPARGRRGRGTSHEDVSMSDFSASLTPVRSVRGAGWFRRAVESRLEGLDHGSRRVVVGLSNRVLGWVTRRLAPAALARRVAGELYRPRNKI